MSRRLLGGMAAGEFLHRHWQKRPLLVRGAWPDIEPCASQRELFELASRSDVESRLVSDLRGEQEGVSWQLCHGPFEEDELRELPARRWTLLVQDVDKHLPAATQLLEAFDFLPRWRLDDLMISIAAPGGSVGPHVDSYDVFLLQACGRRRWLLQRELTSCDYREDTELRVLSHFEAWEDHVLDAGDLLYLPPGVGHWGLAEQGDELCQTYSIGLRAPEPRELLAHVAQALLEAAAEERYSDPDLQPAPARAELAPKALKRLLAPLRQVLALSDDMLPREVARYLTEAKDPEWLEGAAAVDEGGALEWHSAVRWLFYDSARGVELVVHGETFSLPAGQREHVVALTDARRIEPSTADVWRRDPTLSRVLAQLFERGYVRSV